MTEDGKDRKLNLDFEPFKPINTSLYLCDNKFHTEALNELLESDSKYVLCLAVLGVGLLFGSRGKIRLFDRRLFQNRFVVGCGEQVSY